MVHNSTILQCVYNQAYKLSNITFIAKMLRHLHTLPVREATHSYFVLAKLFSSDVRQALQNLNWGFLLNPANEESISVNCINRKVPNVLPKVKLYLDKLKFKSTPFDFWSVPTTYSTVLYHLLRTVNEIPNDTHSETPVGNEDTATAVFSTKSFKIPRIPNPVPTTEIGELMGQIRTSKSIFSHGPRNYTLTDDICQLERALVRHAFQHLRNHGFELLSVPELIHPEVVTACGFPAYGNRNQVFHLNPSNNEHLCLIGTSEMAIAGYLRNTTFAETELPKRFCAISNCFRSEGGETAIEKHNLYRVHQFRKVEMFGVCAPSESDSLLEEFVEHQKLIFSSLNLDFRVLNMPTAELGFPAYRKFDIVTYFPAQRFVGELSSASNCTDYQSRRLNIRCLSQNRSSSFVHTLNATACATSRTLMAVIENNQNVFSNLFIPESLLPFMNGRDCIREHTVNPDLHFSWIKNFKSLK